MAIRAYVCLLQIVCGFLVCLCVVRLPGSSDIPLWISARKEQPGNPHQQAKLSSAAARCPAFTPDALLLIRLSKSRALLISFSISLLLFPTATTQQKGHLTQD